MALTVGELVGYMRMDDAQFNKSLVAGERGMKGLGDVVDRESGRSKGALSGVGKVVTGLAGTMAAVKAVSFLRESIDEAREAREVSRLTANAIRSTGGAAQVSAAQVADLSGAMSKKIGVDDEAIQSAANVLLTFTRVRNEAGKGNDVFNQTVAAAHDMATVMKTDASSAMLQLGKAINDPIKGLSALGRAGVQFTQQQRDQITAMVEAGDVLGAQKVILGELRTQFGGAAAAAADPMDKLAVTVGNIKEEFAIGLLPTVDAVSNALAGMEPETAANVIKFGAMGVAAGGAVVMVGKVVDGTKSTVSALRDSRAAISGWIEKAKAAQGGGGGLAGMLKGGITPALGIAGIALAAGATALFLWQKRKQEATDAVRSYQAALEADNGAIAENTRRTAAQALEQSGALKNAEALGISHEALARAALGNAEAQGRVARITHAAMEDTRQAGIHATHAQLDQEEAAVNLNQSLADQVKWLGEAQQSNVRVEKTTKAMASAQEGATRKAMSLKEAVDSLTRAFDRAEGKAFDVEEATSEYQGALDDLRKSIKDNGTTLDLHTDKGRSNREALRALVSAANDHTEAVFRESGSVKDANAVAARHREELRAVGDRLGVNRGKVGEYADAIRKVPKRIRTKADVDTAAATAAISRLEQRLNNLRNRADGSGGSGGGSAGSDRSFGGSPTPAAKGLFARRPTLALVAESAEARRGGGEVISPVGMMADTFRSVLAEHGGGDTVVVPVVGDVDNWVTHKVEHAVARGRRTNAFRPKARR